MLEDFREAANAAAWFGQSGWSRLPPIRQNGRALGGLEMQFVTHVSNVKNTALMQNTPRLAQIFAGSPQRLQSLWTEIDDPFVFESAEALLSAAQDGGVCGTEKLACASRASKFVSLLSEIRIANLFVRLGCSVEILADEAFGPNGIYTPDLLVNTSFGEILVEVFCGSQGHVNMSTMIHQGLEENDLCFRTTDYLAENLSTPGIEGWERGEAEKRAQATANKLINHLKSLDAQAKGSIEIDGTRFEYEPSPLGRGYHSGGVAAVHWVRSDRHSEKLLLELKRKAVKQQKLPPEKRVVPFVVAYDNRETELRPETAYSALTGSRAWYPGTTLERSRWLEEKRHSYPRQLLAALSGPWERLMHDWDYGPESQVHLNPYGAFYEQEWAQRISAVLLTHVGGSVQWLPNPFAMPELRTPQLLQIPLPTKPTSRDSGEWAHPAWHRYP